MINKPPRDKMIKDAPVVKTPVGCSFCGRELPIGGRCRKCGKLICIRCKEGDGCCPSCNAEGDDDAP